MLISQLKVYIVFAFTFLGLAIHCSVWLAAILHAPPIIDNRLIFV